MFFQRHSSTRAAFILALAITILFTACSPASLPAASQAPVSEKTAAPLPTDAPTSAPAAAETQVYTNPNFGYSLEYPQGFEVLESQYYSITFLAPQGTPGHRERGFLEVELTANQPAEWFANRVKEENAYIGVPISTTVKEIGGQTAYILGGLPGQDLNRQVFIVYKGLLYHLTFMPDTPQAGEDYQQMETLYAAVINSLRFQPERREVPPVTSVINMSYQLEKAFETRSADDITRPIGDEFFAGYWTPDGITFDRVGRNQAAALILSKYLSANPDLTFNSQVDWQSLVGGPEKISAAFPNENIQQPLLVQGWGPQGSDEAVMIIARRMDGSLYWRGMIIAQGKFAQ